jgi:hypothetical protein
MSKNILLAVDAASHDPARHVLAAADMTRDLSRDSGDHVIVLHVHEFATGRFGRIQVDCGDGEGEGVVSKIVSELQAAGAEGEIRETRLEQPDRPAPHSAGQRRQPAPAHGHPAGADRAQDGRSRRAGPGVGGGGGSRPGPGLTRWGRRPAHQSVDDG